MDDRIKVLIVDDSSDIRVLVSKICTRNGWDASVSENGQEAIDVIKKDDSFSFIFMDIKMPIMDGIEAAKIIKELKPSIFIIALSADDKNKYVDDLGRYSPFDDFISKDEMDKIIKVIVN